MYYEVGLVKLIGERKKKEGMVDDRKEAKDTTNATKGGCCCALRAATKEAREGSAFWTLNPATGPPFSCSSQHMTYHFYDDHQRSSNA